MNEVVFRPRVDPFASALSFLDKLMGEKLSESKRPLLVPSILPLVVLQFDYTKH